MIAEDGKKIRGSSGFEWETTNNRAEYTAVLKGLQSLQEEDLEVVVFTDSMLLVTAFTSSVEKWARWGWVYKKTGSKKIKNLDLVKGIYAEVLRIKNVRFQWVKGHSGIKFNEECDRQCARVLEHFASPKVPLKLNLYVP